MKKFNVVLVATLVMMLAMVFAVQVFATDESGYILADDYYLPFEIEVWGDKEEPIIPVYYYSGLEDGKVTSTSRALYGQFDVSFCLKVKNGVKVKLMHYYEYSSIEELGKKFNDIGFLSPGVKTETYKLAEGDTSLTENRFLLQCEIDGKTYYAEFNFQCYAKDYFEIYVYEGNEVNGKVTWPSLDNKTADGATITVNCDVADTVLFGVIPLSDDVLKINGHVNTGREALSEGENNFTLEYKGKIYNLIFRRPETTSWTNPFGDIKSTDAFFNSVKYCNMNRLMLGTSDTTFTPDAITTRAMVVTTLYRIAGSPNVNGTNNFKDVEAGSWYYDAVTWASENGIVLGYDNGNFGTNDNITREQFATIMYRYAKSTNNNLSLSSSNYPYVTDDVADYAKEPMKFAVMSGLIKTTDTINLGPKNEVSRADLAIGIAAMKTFVLPTLQEMNIISN